MSGPSPATDVSCPRCGYDLRGAVAMWREACPLTGTCTECGLDFEWAELLSDAFVTPRWCVESRQGLIRLPRQIAATLARSCRPWRFWSALRMSHPRRWWGVAAYLGLILALLYAAFALMHGWIVWYDWDFVVSRLSRRTTMTGAEIFWRTAALPLGEQPNWGSFWYPRTPRTVFGDVWIRAASLFSVAVIMHVGCGLTFAALPITRRRCKVRWVHVVRVGLYGVVLLVPPVVLSLVAMPMLRMGIRGAALARWAGLAAWTAMLLTEVAWWTAATSRYLRMPHAWAVGSAVTIVGVLLGLAIMGLVWLSVEGP